MSRSENGWEPLHAGPDILEWVTVPGVPVTLRLMKGWPLAILRAFAADYNAYVEPLRDADSAAFTPTNSVATSNHLNGTAMDLNWEGPDRRRFRLGISEAEAFPGDKARNHRELLDFYEGNIFNGGKWSIRDWMHEQMGGNTWNNPRTGDFIARKIRADGFSTYKRGNVVVPPVLSREDRYALVIISVGRELGVSPRGIVIALSVGLVESNLKIYSNSSVPGSDAFYHDAVGRDHDSLGVFQQRPAWGPMAERMTVSGSARIFFLCDVGGGVRGLLKIRDGDGDIIDYNNPAYSMGFLAQKVQGSAFPDRYDARMGDAAALYNRLAGAAPPQPQPQPQEGFLMALTDAQQHQLFNTICGRRASKSPLRPLGQGAIGDLGDFVQWVDGSEHVEVMTLSGELLHPGTLALLEEIATADPATYPDRQEDALLAQAILAKVTNPLDVGLLRELTAELRTLVEQLRTLPPSLIVNHAPPIAAPRETPPLPVPVEQLGIQNVNTNGDKSLGDVVKTIVDAVEQLNLGDALSAKEYATLDASITILKMKNGSV